MYVSQYLKIATFVPYIGSLLLNISNQKKV